jgi:Na+-driven multidrug efflux pump
MLMGCEAVFEGAFTGTGRTIPAMWIGGILTAARIPLAWALAVPLGWGILGIWLAIAITTALKGLVFWLWFERMLSVPGYSGS